MKPDDHKHSGHFDAAMPLPDGVRIKHAAASDAASDDKNPAADLVRRRVDAAYNNEPPAAAEVDEVKGIGSTKQSRHQKFIDELINSDKSLPEIQEAWHEYYAGLPDREKHQVWQEFYAEHQVERQKDSHPAKTGKVSKAPKPETPTTLLSHNSRQLAGSRTKRKSSLKSVPAPVRSLAFGLGIGALVILIFLFGFFNERFIAPFIQPSRTVTNTPIISQNGTVGPNPEIVIPKINVEIPVVYTVSTIDPDTVENALEGGVVHYADTALPGQNGNLVIVGHSSNNIFNQGKYKFAFVLLSRLENGDTFYLDKNGVRYTYQVYQKQIVSPNDVSVLGQQSKPATATLITCDPPGTSANRLVVVGQQISPNPSANVAASGGNALATKAAIIPGNSPTLWSRFVGWFKN